MAIEPTSSVVLVKSPLCVDNQHQLTFKDTATRDAYFASLPSLVLEQDDFTYVRKDNYIKYPKPADSIKKYNYLFYKNKNYSNITYFCFITDVEYVNDNMSYIHIKTDVWQTWQFGLNFKNSFIEREHVTDDSVGANTVPEGLDYGEYICNESEDFAYGAQNIAFCYVLVQVTELVPPMQITYKNTYSGIPQGCFLIALDPEQVTNLVKVYDKAGKADAIVSMAIIPKKLIGEDLVSRDWDTKPVAVAFYPIPESTSAKFMDSYTWYMNSTLDGYKPKNNKLYCFPYNFLNVSNNGGMNCKYNWEDFAENSASFGLTASLSQGMSAKLFPTRYKRISLNNVHGAYDWALTAQKLPMISWNSNFYLNWEAVNGKNIEVQTALTAGKFATDVIGGMLSGNIGGMINAPLSLGQSVANTMQQVKEAEITPNQARGNTNSGDINFSIGKSCFTGYKMSIRKEYAIMLDNYFSAFGYKVNALKVPNLYTRPNWNYIKCTSVNIEAYIPQDDLDEIKGLFNRGITLWHNPATFLDYSQGNK